MMLVEWTSSALDALADIYVAATAADRDEILAAVEMINTELARRPRQLGESRSGNQRVWFADPLVITFAIEPQKARVVVSHVGPQRKHRR